MSVSAASTTVLAKTKLYHLTAAVNASEKDLFRSIAKDLGVSPNAILKQLVLLVVEEQRTVPDLFKRVRDYTALSSAKTKKTQMLRVALSTDVYVKFFEAADEYGSTPATVIRALVALFLKGEIETTEIFKRRTQ